MRERLLQVIEMTSLTKRDFAEAIGIAPSSLSEYFKGHSKALSTDTLVSIKTRFNISLDWLLTGEGEMFLPQKNNDSEMRHSDNASMTDLMNDPQVQRLIVLLSGQREQVSVLNAYLSGTATIKELVATIEKLPEKKRIVALKQIQVLAEC